MDFDLAARVGDRADIIGQFFIKYIGDDQILMILRDITDQETHRAEDHADREAHLMDC